MVPNAKSVETLSFVVAATENSQLLQLFSITAGMSTMTCFVSRKFIFGWLHIRQNFDADF